MKKIKGSVSIYLCIILLSLIIFISVLAERARIGAIQSKCKTVTYMATESVLAGYGKQVFKDYGLLLAWDNTSIEECLKEYMQANINKADLNGIGTNFMDSNVVDVAECDVRYITENGGQGFIEEVKKYIQYTKMSEAVDELMDLFSSYKENKKIENKENITLIAGEISDDLLIIVEKINTKLEEVRDINKLKKKTAVFQETIKANRFNKEYKEAVAILNHKEKLILETISLIEEYKEEKKLYLNKIEYGDSGTDYMENNLIILEELRDEILKVKELNLSQNVKENFQQLMQSYLENIVLKINQLITNDVSEEDRKRTSIFENAKKLINRGVVTLVTEDIRNISKNAISTTNLPSKLTESSSKNLYDKANLLIYSNNKLGNFIKEKQDTALKYEIEYLICGKSSDIDNLAGTIERIIVIRNAINLGVLLTDKTQMNEISNIAISVAMVTGLPFMEVVAKTVLTEALALAESIYEVKQLLNDEKIPIFKTKRDWNVGLNNLLMEPQKSDEGKGLDYIYYCNIILMQQQTKKIVYRMMDLIQENVRLKYNSKFLIEKCFTSIKVKTNFQVEPLFMAMPWTINMVHENDIYNFEIINENSY